MTAEPTKREMAFALGTIRFLRPGRSRRTRLFATGSGGPCTISSPFPRMKAFNLGALGVADIVDDASDASDGRLSTMARRSSLTQSSDQSRRIRTWRVRRRRLTVALQDRSKSSARSRYQIEPDATP